MSDVWVENDLWLGFDFSFSEPPRLKLEDASAAFYDLNLAYEIVALAALPEYENFRFDRFPWWRGSRPLRPEHQAYVGRARYESPFELLTILAPIAAATPRLVRAWVAMIEDLADAPARIRARKRLQEEKAERQREEKELGLIRARIERERALQELADTLGDRRALRDELLTMFEEREANAIYRRIKQRLSANPLEIREVELDAHFPRELPPSEGERSH